MTRMRPIAAVMVAAFAAIAIAPEAGFRVHRHAHHADGHVHVEDLLGRTGESAHEHDHSSGEHHHHAEQAHHHHAEHAEPGHHHHEAAEPHPHEHHAEHSHSATAGHDGPSVEASEHAGALAAAEPVDHVHAGHRFLLVARAALPALDVRLHPEAASPLETAREIRRAQLAARARAPPASPLTSI